MASILIVEDEAPFRERFVRTLQRNGHECRPCGDVATARLAVEEADYDVAFVDLRLPDGLGTELLERLGERAPQTAIIMMTAYAGLESAVESLRHGAVDYLEKPFSFEQALHRLDRVLEYQGVLADNQRLRRELRSAEPATDIIGTSDAMRSVQALIDRVAASPTTVLITGESGTGKELVARQIHHQSRHQKGRLVSVNCAAIPDQLLESELFGHEKGAFTGAEQVKRGLFELADKGTLFLDEIAEMETNLQAKLLRALESREIMRVGGTRPIPIDIRLLVATNRRLADLVATGDFREDLYYRVRVVEIALPPLRARAGDVAILARHFVQKFCRELKRASLGVSNAAMRYLVAYRWPGNVRELQNVIERAMILCSGDWIEPEDLPADLTGKAELGDEDLRAAVWAYEREHIRTVLDSVDNDRKRAAELLGIGVSSLYRKLQEPLPEAQREGPDPGLDA